MIDNTLLIPPSIQNYVQLLTRDSVFRKVAWNTLYFMLTIVPLQLAFGLALAVTLNQQSRGRPFYRIIFFMPVVTTIVAGAIIFQFLLNRDFGLFSSWVWMLAEWTGWGHSAPRFSR